MEKTTKICFMEINPFPEYSGGIETWLFNIAEKLSQVGFQVSIFSPKRTDFAEPFFDMSKLKNVRLVRFSAVNSINSLFKKHLHYLWRVIFTSADYFFWTVSATFQLIFAKNELCGASIVVLGPVPVIFPVLLAKPFIRHAIIIGSVRGRFANQIKEKTKNALVSYIFKFVETYCLKKCSLVLANGYDTQQYLKDGGVSAEVLPNGVDFSKFASQPFETASNHAIEQLKKIKLNGGKIITMTASLMGPRGAEYLIQAVPLIRKKVPNIKVVFVGKGDPNAYIDLAEKLNVRDTIFFAGQQNEINSFLWLTDIVTCLSVGGGFSHSLLEAMAAKKPIIAWNTDSYTQILRHRENALLVKKYDIEDMAKQIIILLNDDKLAAELGKKAQSDVERYDWSIIAGQLKEFINSVRSQ